MSSMQPSHEALLDLVAVHALGALGAEEARYVSAHLAVCEDCRREYEALRPAADAIAYAADDRLDARICAPMKAKIMKAAAEAIRPAPAVRHRPLMWSAGLAFAAALVFAFLSVTAERRLGDLQLTGARAYDVSGGEILRTPERVYIVMRALPAPPSGRVYQAWTLAPGAKSVTPSITFVPDAHGFVVVSLPQPASAVDAVAISVEPRGGSESPTTKPLFVRPLT